MNLKKIFLVTVLVILISTISYGSNIIPSLNSDNTVDNTIDINISDISNHFNSSPYVEKIKNLGIKISAKQTDTILTLSYDNTYNLEYTIDNNSKKLSVFYSKENYEAYLKYDILNAILIDSIFEMQGNSYCSLAPFVLSDIYCYSIASNSGIEKNYILADDDTPATEFNIYPCIKFTAPSSNVSIEEATYRSAYETFFDDVDSVVKEEDMILYKTFSEDGSLIFYIGEPNELSSRAYESILTAADVFFNYNDSRVSNYIKQNYSDISIGNYSFDGINIDTNITELPISTIDTVLLSNNMKYAKFTINRDIIKEKLNSVSENENSTNNSVKIENNKFSTFWIVTVIIVSILILVLLIKFFMNKYNS